MDKSAQTKSLSFLGRLWPQAIINEASTLPDELPTAVAGVIVNKRVQARHIASTLFDLGQRGYLTVCQEGEEVTFLRTNQTDQDLYLSEQLLLRDLFTAYQQTIPLSQLPPRLAKLMQASEPLLKKEKKQVLRTMKKDRKKKWRQFAHYLHQDEPIETAGLFGRYFGFAVSFGWEAEWALRFVHQTKAALPDWYQTSYPKQHLTELIPLARTITTLITNRAPAYQIPIILEEYVKTKGNIGDSAC